MHFPRSKITVALIVSHFGCLILGWYVSGRRWEGTLDYKNLEKASSTGNIPAIPRNGFVNRKVPPALASDPAQPPLVYDGSGRVSIDIDKLSLSIQPILSNFELDPRFLDLLGASQQQQQKIREILLEQKKMQDDLETNSFKLLEQNGGNVTFVVENTPEAAKAARKLLEEKLEVIMGSNAGKVFIKCADEFLQNNSLYTDNVRVFTTEVLSPELAHLSGASRNMSVWTLRRQFIDPNTTIDAEFINSARSNNFLSGGEGYTINDIPERMRHLIE